MKDIKIQLYKEDGKGTEGFLTITSSSDFPITKALGDIKDISKRKSTTTKSITIGGTKENNKLLGYIYDIDSKTLTFDINKVQKCAVIIDDELFLNNCILQLTDINKVQHNSAYESDIEYTVNIKTNNADFFSVIKQKELTDLNFSSKDIPNKNFIFNSTNIINTFNNNYTDGFKYVLPAFSGNTPHSIPINTFSPAIYLRTYFDKILNEANFRYTFPEINGSDKLLHFNKLLVPFLNKLDNEARYVDLYTVDATSANSYTILKPATVNSLTGKSDKMDMTFTTEIQDQSNSWNGNRYEVQFDGELEIIGTATINASLVNSSNSDAIIKDTVTTSAGRIGNLNLYYVLELNGVEIPNTSSFIGSVAINNNTNILSFETINLGTISGNVMTKILVKPGDIVKVKTYTEVKPEANRLVQVIYNTSIINFGYVSTSTIVSNTGIRFDSLLKVSQSYGNPIDINDFIPKKIKQSDFIKGIMNLFNLYVIPDEYDYNLLHFKTRDKFFDEGITLDWTNYLVKDKEQTLNKLSQDENKRKIFSYKEDKDIKNELYKAETNEVYGQTTFIFDDENIYDEDKLEIIFSPSPFVYQQEDNMYLTSMPVDSNIRLLYDGGMRNCASTLLEDKIVNNIKEGTYINQYPLSIHFDDEHTPTFDLNFGVCPAYFSPSIDVLTNNNAFNNYWRRTIYQLNNGYLYTAYFRLTESMVASLKLNEKIYVDGKWYNINQIKDFNPAKSNIVKVELITIDDGVTAYKGIVTDTIKPVTINPDRIPGKTDVFIDNNTINSNPGRTNTGIGKGNIIFGIGNDIFGDGNTVTTDGVKVKGNGNTINSPGIIYGNNNNIIEGLKNVFVIGDDNNVTESNTIATDNIIVNTINGDSFEDIINNIINDVESGLSIPTKTSDLTNDSDFQNGTQVNNAINTALASVYKVKGSVPTYSDLPTTGRVVGDVWNVIDTDMNYVWTGSDWDALGISVDLSNYYTITETDDAISDAIGDLVIPTKTSDLTNDSGFITNADIPAQLTGSNTINLSGQEIRRNALSGDVTASNNSNTTTISNNVVSNAKLTDMSANTIKGNNTNSTADPKDLTVAEVKSMLENNVVDITKANLITLCNNGTVVIGQYYRVTNEENSIFIGRTSKTVESQFVIVPTVLHDWYKYSSSTVYKGVLKKGSTYTAGDYVVWGGRVWIKGTGTQTATNLPTSLTDANTGGTITNWTMISVADTSFYKEQVLKLEANIFTNNPLWFVYDGNGNKYGGNNFYVALRSDFGNDRIYSNTAFYIINNSNFNSGDSYNTYNVYNNILASGSIYNNTNNGTIADNTNIGNIDTNSNNGAIYRNSNKRHITNNSNNGAIWNNSNAGTISANSNANDIYYNDNLGNISANSNNGLLGYNSNNGDITNNTSGNNILLNYNGGDINNNSNTGVIYANGCSLHINSNSNIGNIQYNINSGSITSNSNNGLITSNSNNGNINNNTSAVTSINTNSNLGTISANSNTGVIQSNYNSGNISNNSNLGQISTNSNSGNISLNTVRGEIVANNNNGIISNNKPNVANPTNNCNITRNSNNGQITDNTTGSNITTNSNDGNINNNSNTGSINTNNNNGSISYNSNSGDIFKNSSTGSINNNTNTWYIGNNSNSGDIFNNSNSGRINDNNNTGNINDNSNTGNIEYNANTGHINNNSNTTSGSAIGYISHNTNTGDILYNSIIGYITKNSNLGVIGYNKPNVAYPTSIGSIIMNSNGGDIGGIETSLGNAVAGDIGKNSNSGSIFKNSNSASIFKNNNNGGIYNNSGSGRIYDNNNTGNINDNNINGEISYNSNTSIIFNNNSNSGFINNSIIYNRNNGYIGNVTFNASNISVYNNTNNGNISGTKTSTVSDPIVDK